ncbi:SARP family transcriptional regulator [Streptomyces sp. SID5785]|uniref:BTAD domain-containing putative transcriptional regulator n=1 Tax=Streptomyces sp. SID5785 TaxID=2690309 RepID=UPI001360DD8F|nr:BTAD domain-containing putative transcriptional regulator [Streptomyces sp. SID5785]MZD04392.1 SARP family transcriptional regulator [Streptomyces sp. SID5785]
MDFLLLGPFTARHDGAPVVLTRRRQERLLLVTLLLREGRTVAAGRLIDALWPEGGPADPRGTLHTYAGRLRAALRPYGIALDRGRDDGYALTLPAQARHTIDAVEFTDLLRRADASADALDRVRLYDAALALWRGSPPRVPGAAPLEELRLTALERRAEALLESGDPARAAADLTTVVAEHPTRERLVAHAMTALHRCGRRAEALELFRATRRRLATDHGVEPGPDLHALHDQVLRGDRRLEAPQTPVHAVRIRDVWLPWNTSGHPALEFCNTYAGWGGPRLPGSEWLRGYRSLAAWAGHLDLAEDAVVTRLLEEAEQDPRQAADVVDEARDFRAQLYACLTDPADRRAFRAVARAVEAAGRLAVFERDADGLARWRIPAHRSGLRLPLHAVARSAGELLADPRRFTVSRCPSAECGWLFLDASGRRRWCSLATCGRRA